MHIENTIILESDGVAGSSGLAAYGPTAPTWAYNCVTGLAATITGSVVVGPYLVADPMFVDGDGPDGVYGTADDDFRLLPGSPCIDAGDNAGVPLDRADVDGDGDVDEATPLDFAGSERFIDDPDAPDTGVPGAGHSNIVDIGAHEVQVAATCPWDVDGSMDGDVGIADLLLLLGQWGSAGAGDVNGDGTVDVIDMLALLSNWGPCP